MHKILPSFKKKLDKYQFEAATCGDGPKRCNAGAGSGKTSTYAHRIVHLLHNNVPPESILATTFTKKAADEMKHRIKKVAQDNGIEIRLEGLWIGTFHSLGIRACRMFSPVIDYESNFTIDDEDDQDSQIKKIIKSIDALKNVKMLKSKDILSAISYARNSGRDYFGVFTEKLSQVVHASVLVEIAEKYEEQKRKRNAFDFDDMLIYWLDILEKSADARAYFQNKFEYVLVDEYQDTNYVQNKIIDIIASSNKNIFVVGDDRQCFPGNTMVHEHVKGQIPIENVVVGDLILSACGSGGFDYNVVDHVFRRMVKDSGIEIETESGIIIKSTKDHVFFSKIDIGILQEEKLDSMTLFPESGHSFGNNLIELNFNGKKELHPIDGYSYILDWIESVHHNHVINLANITSDNIPFEYVHALRMKKGMIIPIFDPKTNSIVEDTIKEVKTIELNEYVYDLSIPQARNFMAENIIVHNSIYSFRAAEISNILDFERRYPDCEDFNLKNNYRSSPEIVSAALSSISRNKRQLHKEVETPNRSGTKPRVIVVDDEKTQNKHIVNMIKRLNENGVPYSRMAVIYRNNNMSVSLEQELNKQLVPYQKKGAQFWKKSHIKLATSWLKMIQNPLDQTSLGRSLEIYNGIGPTSISKFVMKVETQEDWDSFLSGDLIPIEKKPSMFEPLRNEIVKINDIIAMSENPVVESVRHIIDILEPYTREEWSGEEGITRAEDFAVFLDLSTDFDSIQGMLEAISVQEDRKNKKERDEVTLATGHGAKGLEWDIVFLIGVVEGSFPSSYCNTDEEWEEERRLFYVMLTRAKSRLFIFCPKMVKKFGKATFVQPSQFVKEIDPELLEFKSIGSQ